MTNNYLVMNEYTSECEVYYGKENAEKNLGQNCFICPCEIVDNEDNAEVILYDNADKSSKLSLVAEFIDDDILKDDLKEATQDNPIKVVKG